MALHYSFKPAWTVSVGLIGVFSLFISLGFWQLRRAEEKQALMATRQQRAMESALLLDGKLPDSGDWRYRSVVVEGEYDPAHQFLLDNQIHAQKAGFHVLTPMRMRGGDEVVLVNRGWISGGPERGDYPPLAVASGPVRIAGVVDRFPGVGWKLAGAEIPGPGWPSLVQLAEPGPLGNKLGHPVLPFQVLLDPAEPDGYVRDWRETRLTPEKNRGYALQWFLFAAIALILYLRHAFSRRPSPVS